MVQNTLYVHFKKAAGFPCAWLKKILFFINIYRTQVYPSGALAMLLFNSLIANQIQLFTAAVSSVPHYRTGKAALDCECDYNVLTAHFI